MKTYKKGTRAEREWLDLLNYRGFATIRAPASGSSAYPVDVVAIKKGRVFAFEIKCHKRKPRLSRKKVQEMREWCDRAEAMGFLAWRKRGKEWLFLRLEDMEDSNYKDENWINQENLLKALDFK